MVECSPISNAQYGHLRGWDSPATDEVDMQVLCKSTNGNAETHCCVCGQGFVMFWDRQSRAERMAALHEIQETLRRHHRDGPGPEAHPKESFPVPEWSGSSVISGPATPGTVPTWDL